MVGGANSSRWFVSLKSCGWFCAAAAAAAAVSDLACFLALRAGEFAAGGLLAITIIGSGGDDDVDAHPYLRHAC
jgi:hypothetical protein